MPFSSFCAIFDDKVIDQGAVDGVKNVTQATKDVAGILIDDVLIDGLLVDGVGGAMPSALGSTLRTLQNGRVQRYLLVAVAALVVVLIWRGF